MSEEENLMDKNTSGTPIREANIKDENRIAVNQRRPPISKLNTYCVYEILDYLMLYEIHALSQTCRSLRRAVAEYFEFNYGSTGASVEYGKLISRLYYVGRPLHNFNGLYPILYVYSGKETLEKTNKKLKYMSKHCSRSLKELHFKLISLTGNDLQCIEKTFRSLEALILVNCKVNSRFYQRMPQICTNLKRLHVRDVVYHRKAMKLIGNEWLMWTYPMLEHLEWIQSKPIDELAIFFRQNPNVHSFATDIDCLWSSRRILIDSKIELDDLAIEFGDREYVSIEQYCLLFKELHELRIFRRLHLNFKCFNQSFIDQITSLDGLHSLWLGTYLNQLTTTQFDLSKLVSLRELAFTYAFRGRKLHSLTDLNLLTDKLINLERFRIEYGSFKGIMPFIHRSPRLNQLVFDSIDVFKPKYINLFAINETRRKLSKSCKTTLYVDENVFTNTKFAMKGILELDRIEIKRATAHNWSKHFHDF